MGRIVFSVCPALALALLCSACPNPGAVEPSGAAVAKDAALLLIPVTAETRPAAVEALARLTDRATGGDIAAAWARIHYLIDLFDDARFRGDERSRRMLHEALGRTDDQPERGAAATDWVLAELTREVDDIIGGDRMHPHAQSARTLLEWGSRPPVSRVGLLTRMAELKSIAQGDHPLADNARLRLAGYCRNALVDIATARYAQRHRVLAHCLYPLYASNPEPYFARRAEDRPPVPRWSDIRDDLVALLTQVAQGQRRLAGAGVAYTADVIAATTKHAAKMPVAPVVDALGVAQAERVTPYDWTPLLLLRAGEHLHELSDKDALSKKIAGDERRIATVALTADAPADALVQAAQAVAQAGAQTLELAVGMKQQLKVPRGDYWHRRLHGQTTERLGVIPLSLVPLLGASAIDSRTWDTSRARLALHLLVTRETWTLTSPTGQVVEVSASAKERAMQTLRGILAWVYAAFPDEDAVVVVPGPGARVSDLVNALQAVRFDDQGRRLMTQVGLAARAPTPSAKTLAERIARRSKATVAIQPSALAVRASVVRACYQGVLDARPDAKGDFRLELAGDIVSITSGPADKELRQCLTTGLVSAMKAQKMASAEVQLSAE